MSLSTAGKRKRALVLGASGYIGQHVSLSFLETDWEVIGLGTREIIEISLQKNKFFSYMAGDITDPDIQEKVAATNPDVIVFCVSLDQKSSEENISRALEVNVGSVWNFLDRVNSKLSKPIRLIYLSTIQVYADLLGKIDEHYPVGPRNVYGLTHLMAEMVTNVSRNLENIHPTVLRLSNGYGPPVGSQSACWSLVVNDFCRTAYQEKTIRILSAGTALRDFVFVRDLAQAIVEVALCKQEKRLLNIVSGKTMSLLNAAVIVRSEYFRRFDKKISIVDVKGDEFELPKSVEKEPTFIFNTNELKESNIKMGTEMREGVKSLFSFLERHGI